MRSRCGGVIGSKRHASAMHPIVTFRMRTRCERWRMLSGMRDIQDRYERHTGQIRDDSYFKNPPPLGMGGGGEI